MKKITLLLLISFSTLSFSQRLENCSSCSKTKIIQSDIEKNKLFEIELLRNEIFAKHGYEFKNERLNEYYSKFSWYKESRNITFQTSNLNSTENHNIQIFKNREAQIKKNRDELISKLKTAKQALSSNDKNKVETLINGIASDNNAYELLKITLTKFEIENINWFKGKALYSITVDNGVNTSTQKIEITDNQIIISNIPIASSSNLMDSDAAFEYPSTYYSEDEYSQILIIEINKNELKFKSLFTAG